MFFINFQIAFEQLWANKLRAFLTVLGIIIGVAATIVVISLTEGFSTYVNNFLVGMGTNALWVAPDKREIERRSFITQKDIDAVSEEVDDIRYLSPSITMPCKIKFNAQEISTSIIGCNPEFQYIRNFYVNLGRCFSPVEMINRKQICVIGTDIAKQLGIGDKILNQYVSINNRRFKVVGILEEKGSFFGNSQDEIILIPYTTLLKMSPLLKNSMNFTMSIKNPDLIIDAKLQIEDVLRRKHNILPSEKSDFRIFTQDEILEEFNRFNRIAAAVLVSIVGISLLVGGIGIMNIMLVSVTERTREIGLRKAVGAKDFDILSQFLTEATVLSMVGGIFGIFCGFILSHIVKLYPDLEIPVTIPIWAILLGFSFSVIVGIVFGFVPALKASGLQPIDALRHE